jgi:hypothetical protein
MIHSNGATIPLTKNRATYQEIKKIWQACSDTCKNGRMHFWVLQDWSRNGAPYTVYLSRTKKSKNGGACSDTCKNGRMHFWVSTGLEQKQTVHRTIHRLLFLFMFHLFYCFDTTITLTHRCAELAHTIMDTHHGCTAHH